MGLFKRFADDRRGATAIIFGLSLFPLIFVAGAAVDYSRASKARAALQTAVDATALQLVRDARQMSDGQLQARGAQIFSGMMASQRFADPGNIRVTRASDEVRVEADANVRNAFMHIAGFAMTPIAARSQAATGNKRIELALVLDNTGSMSRLNRMTELQRASRNLLRTLNEAAPAPETIRVSIVPFHSQVRVDANAFRFAPWMHFNTQTARNNWTGYIEDRAQPFDVNSEPADLIRPETLHPASSSSYNLARIIPLTSAMTGYANLLATVDSMRPDGCTNITIGTSWGAATLRSDGPLPGATPLGTPNVEKIMIVLTDGDNTENRWVKACNRGNIGRPADIDVRTRAACDSAKRAGIRLYMVRLIEGNANLLRDCASRGANGQPLFYDVQEASQLNGVFQSIVNEILATRLTN